MTLAISYRTAGSAARRVWWAALLVVCASLVTQPCVMALEGEHDCPHCPPQHSQHMAGHGHHAGHEPEASSQDMAGHGHHAGHEPEVSPCGTLADDCGVEIVIAIDHREGQPAADETPDSDPEFAACRVLPEDSGVVAHSLPTAATGPPHIPPAQRLHLLNCVFLD